MITRDSLAAEPAIPGPIPWKAAAGAATAWLPLDRESHVPELDWSDAPPSRLNKRAPGQANAAKTNRCSGDMPKQAKGGGGTIRGHRLLPPGGS